MRKKRRKPWPAECVWPEPLTEGEGESWDADDARMLKLDAAGEELLDIKAYFDACVEEGRLNEDYSLNEEWGEDRPAADWTPEVGEEYWYDGFDIDAWEVDLTNHINLLKIPAGSPEDDPVYILRDVTGYEFINENLLRQAFTRRAFAEEYALYGSNEELEFIGDTVLNTLVTREMAKQLSETLQTLPEAPFQSVLDEGELTRLRNEFVSGEALSAKAAELGFDRFILYGSAEEHSEKALEDAMEALIGAIMVDNGWDWDAAERAADRMLDLQITNPDELLKQTFYDLFNAWHQKRFGAIPAYELTRLRAKGKLFGGTYLCTIRFQVPANDRGISPDQRFDVEAETRSKAREEAARRAYSFVVSNGLWMNLTDAGVIPRFEDSINQLQELFQKKYIDAPSYEFEETTGGKWHCECLCSGVNGYGTAASKVKAKKKAAFMVLVRLLDAAGICRPEWKEQMWAMGEE